MKRLTKEQGIILTGFTGKLCCDFTDFLKDLEKRLKRSILTHELLMIDTKEIYKEDFIKILAKSERGEKK